MYDILVSRYATGPFLNAILCDFLDCLINRQCILHKMKGGLKEKCPYLM